MAKSSNRHETGKKVTTISRFGSHSDMVLDPTSAEPWPKLEYNEVVCKDDEGYYITLTNRLDTGLADPNRYSTNKRIELTEYEQGD